METENIRWLTDHLRLASLEETADGEVVANVHAQAALGAREWHGTTLLEAASLLLGEEIDGDALQRAIDSARDGRPASITPREGVLALVMPVAPGRARLIVSSVRSPLTQALESRAAAADLAAGVSHEVGNALSAIVGWAQLARQRPDKATPEEALALIQESAEVARDHTQDLLRMVRHSNHEKAQTDLSVVVRDVVRLLRPEAQEKRVSIHEDAEQAAWVPAKRSQLFSIVWNLAHNAVQMLGPGGEVRLAVRQLGDGVELQVDDDGPGMTAEQKARVFDPYYTTREEGTGLGLAIVRETVDALGGRVRLDSAPGQGALFRIELPSTQRLQESGELQRPARISRVIKPEQAEQTHVLVVEDDEGVRGLISMTLALGGLQATCLGSAAEALARPEHFSAALIDLTLPDERGDVLLEKLRARGTIKQAAIMSGAAPPKDMGPAGQPDRWLRKPFDPSEVIECVRELVNPAVDEEPVRAPVPSRSNHR